MEEFLEEIRSNKMIRTAPKADVRNIISCKNNLKENHIVVFPEDYTSFVKNINGIVGDSISLYGVCPDSKLGFSDIAEENSSLTKFDKNRFIVLGYNKYDYLVYDEEEKAYQARDQFDGIVFERFRDISSAVSYLLRM